MDVQVIGDLENGGRGSLCIFCDDNEFSMLDHGDRLFHRVAEHIYGKRRSGAAYPIYITDIDINPAMLGTDNLIGVQSIHFLNYKKRIESHLNEALKTLRSQG